MRPAADVVAVSVDAFAFQVLRSAAVTCAVESDV
jgi:hypothetical protein